MLGGCGVRELEVEVGMAFEAGVVLASLEEGGLFSAGGGGGCLVTGEAQRNIFCQQACWPGNWAGREGCRGLPQPALFCITSFTTIPA